MKGYIIFNKDVAAKLMLAGEEIVSIRKDKKEESKNIYVFQNTKTIQRNIKDILQK